MQRILGAGLAAAMLSCALPLTAHAVGTPPTPPAPSAHKAAPVRVMVMLKDQPTAPSADAEASRLADQNALVERWAASHGLTKHRQFGYLVNGFAAEVPADQIAALALEPEVASVRRERVYQPVEHTARDLEGVPAAFAKYGVDGTGMVVSIIDSGIDATHRDMRLDDCAKAKIQTINPNNPGHFTCKVPDGYNYADENYTVWDTTTSQHGMHVAGIVAANGSEGTAAPDFAATGRIDGVAPNAQLLAMKVFSNNGGGAQDSDIIAAIEDSVKKGADVINMSLGAPNSVKDTSDGSARAIDAARKAGVIAVIAAGNDGLNFSPAGETTDELGLFDDGTAGSPAVMASGFTVASVDNAAVSTPKALWTSGGVDHAVGYDLAIGTADGTPHQLVDVGLGKDTDYPAGLDLTGKYALVQRGGITFAEKFQRAIDHHADGVVIYNSAGNEDYLGMGGIEKMTVFGASLKHSDGAAIAAALKADPTLTMTFTSQVIVTADPRGAQPSSFTSWGTTPTLDFEPEIAAVGGNVYSTLNGDKYGSKSGTSMATPNVAGMAALMLQQLKAQEPGTPRGELLDRVEAALMNTAQIPQTAGVPAAPRQIGAGMARVDRALLTTVTATVDGRPSIALREINAPRPVTVTLTNRGTAPVSYDVPAQQAVTETNVAGEVTTTQLGGGTVTAGATSVTVPAQGTATVTFTITPDAASSHYLEGWLRLTSTTDGQPDLAVPYLGFVGDWNAEPIISPVGEDVVPGVAARTDLATSWAGMTIPLVSDMGSFWQSPNGDSDMDVVAPMLALRRNAVEIRYQVLREDGTLLKDLGSDWNQHRETLGALAKEPDPTALMITGRSFDGTTWDPAKGDFVAVPDGHYVYRVQARLGDGWPWQNTDLPFGVDHTAPVITFGDLVGTTLTFTVVENGSGLLADPEITAADGSSLPVTKNADGSYSVQITDPTTIPYVTASVLDAGFNLGTATKVFAANTLVVADAASYDDPTTVIGPKSPVMTDGSLRLTGYVSGTIAKVRVGSTVVDSGNGRFILPTPLVEGRNTIVVEGLDAAGNVVATVTVHPTYDATAPVVDLSSTPKDAAGKAIVNPDGTVTVSGTITDTRPGATLTVKVDGKAVPVNPDGTFSVTVTPAPDATAITVVGSDVANTTTVALPLAGRVAAWDLPMVTNADCLPAFKACFVPVGTPDLAGGTFTLKGKVGGSTSSIVFTPAPGVDGSVWTGQTPIPATIAADGTFTVALPLVTGINHFRLQITDADGTVRFDNGTRLYFDATAPTVHFTNPSLYDGTLYANADQVQVVGTAFDDGWGYKLQLNDSVVVDVMYQTGLGPDSNRRDFATPVLVKDGDQLLLVFHDTNGNALTGVVPVVVDKAAPTVTLPVVDGEVVTDARPVTTTATDPHLATMKVSLDGTVVADLATPKAGLKAPLESALVADATTSGPASAAGAAGNTTKAVPTATPSAAVTAAPGAASTPTPTPAAPSTTKVDVRAAVAEQTSLQHTLATSGLAAGPHTLLVESADLAGNTTVKAVTFVVNAAPVIVGPDAATITVGRELLGNQPALGAEALTPWGVTDDDTPRAALSLAPGTVLVEGANTVTLVADDGVTRTERTVTVTVALKTVTLADHGATATSTFRTDDALTATSTTAADGTVTWVLSNKPGFASLDATITLPGVEGSTVALVLPDGRLVPVQTTWADGVLTFTGPSQGTYRVFGPRAAVTPGEGTGTLPGNPGGAPAVSLPAPGIAKTGAPEGLLGLGMVGLTALGLGAATLRRRD